jgi:hypothetical protein
MSAVASGTCRICREVKDGSLRELPIGLTPVGETIPGGVVVRHGEGPVPFVCSDCEARQRNGEVGLIPGQVIEVELDDEWKLGLFVRPGDLSEAELVGDPRVDGGERQRDVAFVRVARGSTDQRVPYARIRLPG